MAARDRLPATDAVLVSYSGGKDSLAVMDLCARSGKRVRGFILAFLPGLDHTAHWIEYAKSRWGVEVREYQDPKAIQWLRMGRFRSEPLDVPAITTRDIEEMAREDAGIEWIGYGHKAADCIDRRLMLKTWPNGISEKWRKFAPLFDWRQNDVLAYLSRNRIEIPTAGASIMSGIGLSPRSLAWMRESWPDDYKRILKVFPHASGQADRAARIREQHQAERECRKASARAKRAALADQASQVQSADAL